MQLFTGMVLLPYNSEENKVILQQKKDQLLQTPMLLNWKEKEKHISCVLRETEKHLQSIQLILIWAMMCMQAYLFARITQACLKLWYFIMCVLLYRLPQRLFLTGNIWEVSWKFLI